ncbi:MAG: Eco57I restriction-modification methylase domain-containing protein [Phycisphaerae bacterium]|nr:Eco57I restriction-modification methylase domain-containing protein [Phycisphaerae bacterium]
MTEAERKEEARQELQAQLHARKDQAQRNKLGQFSTPAELASDIIRLALSWLPAEHPVRFLEPGFGTGPFYSALLRNAPRSQIEIATGYEIDADYIEPTTRLWGDTGLHLNLGDFTKAEPPARESAKYNVVVCNPPYVRHHHLSSVQKQQLHALVSERLRFQMNGLSGLYTYFMVLSQAWMAPGGIGAWLVPSEFMDVNYGRKVKEFLVGRVTLKRIHRFDPKEVQFDDALVSSAVVFFTNTPPPENHRAEFSFGGTLSKPKVSAFIALDELDNLPKWTHLPQPVGHRDKDVVVGTLADLFTIKRGLATGCNPFFILTLEQAKGHELPAMFLRPILPSPKQLETTEILSDSEGDPLIEKRRYLLSCDLPAELVREEYPTLWAYLQCGMRDGLHERYLCRHREPWYCQETRPPAPFLCTYMGRPTSRSPSPFRFILNHSQATATNVYLMLYPRQRLAALLQETPGLAQVVWRALCSITAEHLIGHGRTYGGGLHKLEPRELADASGDIVLRALPKGTRLKSQRQLSLFRS